MPNTTGPVVSASQPATPAWNVGAWEACPKLAKGRAWKLQASSDRPPGIATLTAMVRCRNAVRRGSFTPNGKIELLRTLSPDLALLQELNRSIYRGLLPHPSAYQRI